MCEISALSSRTADCVAAYLSYDVITDYAYSQRTAKLDLEQTHIPLSKSNCVLLT